jgi:fused signal recognition particle receptor
VARKLIGTRCVGPARGRAASLAALQGLRKTGSSIAAVFTGTRIDEALYEDLEVRPADGRCGRQGHAAPAGRPQKAREGEPRPPIPPPSRALLAEAHADLLQPLQKPWSLASTNPP